MSRRHVSVASGITRRRRQVPSQIEDRRVVGFTVQSRLNPSQKVGKFWRRTKTIMQSLALGAPREANAYRGAASGIAQASCSCGGCDNGQCWAWLGFVWWMSMVLVMWMVEHWRLRLDWRDRWRIARFPAALLLDWAIALQPTRHHRHFPLRLD